MNTSNKILVVDDDEESLSYIRHVLENAGHRVLSASSAKSCMLWLSEPGKPDLIILDIELRRNEPTGLDISRQIKIDPRTRRIPIVILTAHSGNHPAIEAHLAHADLFLTKPVLSEDLLEAVQELTKPAPETRRGLVHYEGLEVDPEQHTVHFAGKILSDLSPRLFDLFHFIISNSPNTLSRTHIVSKIQMKVSDREVDVLISRLRKRLLHEFKRDFIETVPTLGYRAFSAASVKQLH